MSTNDKQRVAVIGGDGTGPEVAAEGVKVLKAVGALDGIDFEFTDFDYGGDRYLATGEVLPEGALEELAQFDSNTYSAKMAESTTSTRATANISHSGIRTNGRVSKSRSRKRSPSRQFS